MPHKPISGFGGWLGSSGFGRSFMGDGSGEGSRDLSELVSDSWPLGSGCGGVCGRGASLLVFG